MAAGRAAAGAFAALVVGGSAADAAEAVRAVPVQHLRGAAGQAGNGRREAHHRRAQRHRPPTVGHRGQSQGPAVQAVELAQVVADLSEWLPAAQRQRLKRHLFSFRQQQLAVNESQTPVLRRGFAEQGNGGDKVHDGWAVQLQ